MSRFELLMQAADVSWEATASGDDVLRVVNHTAERIAASPMDHPRPLVQAARLWLSSSDDTRRCRAHEAAEEAGPEGPPARAH